MSSFDDRENTFEKKYAHDEELRFKVAARRNKMFGLWAAEKLGKTPELADAYAKEVIVADLKDVGDDDVLQKVLADFKAAGVDTNAEKLRKKMDALLAEAKASLMSA